MKTYKKYWILVFMLLGTVSFSIAQIDNIKPTIKVNVYYTLQAESINSTIWQKIIAQELEVKTIVGQINSFLGATYDYDMEIFPTRLDNYKEPKHRTDGYVKSAFHGTTQVLEEMMTHRSLSEYYNNGNINPPGKYKLSREELDQNFLAISDPSNPEINIIIADEEGEQMVLSPNTLQVSEFNNTVGTVDNSLYVVISAQEFKDNPNALAIAIFSLLGDPDEATYVMDNLGNFSSYSLLGYWLEEGKNLTAYPNAQQIVLSDQNMKLFQCNMAKLNLVSRDEIAVERSAKKARTQSVVDVVNYATIVPRPITPDIEDNSVVFTTEGSDSYIVLSTKSYTETSFSSCPYVAPTNSLGRLANTEETPFINTNEEETTTDSDENELTTSISLPYPNPTNGDVTFNVTLAESGVYKLALYDIISGQQVRVLFDKNVSAGEHKIKGNVSGLKSAIYIYRLESERNLPISGRLIVK